jgi:hypothetical protein
VGEDDTDTLNNICGKMEYYETSRLGCEHCPYWLDGYSDCKEDGCEYGFDEDESNRFHPTILISPMFADKGTFIRFVTIDCDFVETDVYVESWEELFKKLGEFKYDQKKNVWKNKDINCRKAHDILEECGVPSSCLQISNKFEEWQYKLLLQKRDRNADKTQVATKKRGREVHQSSHFATPARKAKRSRSSSRRTSKRGGCTLKLHSPASDPQSKQLITFGKHTGKTFLFVAKNDTGYCTWAKKQENPSGPLAVFVEYLKSNIGI